MTAALPDLRAALARAASAVLTAPPGSGKTTRVPLALLGEPWLAGQRIVMLEPRRLAARAAAARMAELLGEGVGETVGYRVRFDARVGPRTRVEVVTEGILVRRLQGDPGLEGAGLVVLDEFHERSLQGDLGLALLLDVQRALRPELRLLVMSATLDAAGVAGLMGDVPVVTAQGRLFPVDTVHLSTGGERGIPEAAAVGVRRALAEGPGDVLVFLPGGREIRRLHELLEANGVAAGLVIHPLYGDLPKEDQDRAIRPDTAGRRKLVLATNIAETSLTIEGVHVVVDTGWMRAPRFDPNTGLTRLETLRISRASAQQRAGRAGRLGPGRCYRLWSEGEHGQLRAFDTPEILQADLANLALELAAWGVADPTGLPWLDPPPGGAFRQAQDLLCDLEALDARGHLTELGRRMAELPFHPRLAHMLLRARAGGEGAMACDLAALLTEGDVLTGQAARASVDVEERVQALAEWRAGGAGAARQAGASPAACTRVARASDQARRLLGLGSNARLGDMAAGGTLIAYAYPDRVGQRAGAEGRYRLANGRGVRLALADPLSASPYLAVAHLDAGATEGRVHLAARIDLEALRAALGERVETRAVVSWDDAVGAVSARRETRAGSLLLESTPLRDPEPGAVEAAMLVGLRRRGLDVLPWTDAARELQARVLSLGHWLPEEAWPDLSDAWLAAHLEAWLAPYLAGVSRLDHLRRLDLAQALGSGLSWDQRRRLDEGAPTHLTLPNGRRRALEYRPGEPPILAARLQELFGLMVTPRVCWGRVPVMVHILSPAGRPVQVTQDLTSFWERTYQEVRRELRGRYPKHAWPEDPRSAPPVGPGRRRS